MQNFDRALAGILAEAAGLKLLLMFDFDGTIAPLAPRPDLARLTQARRRLLARLARTPGISVAIVTGRSLKDIGRLAPIPGAILAANHGFEVRLKKRVWHPRGKGFARTLEFLGRMAKAQLGSVPGIVIEAKGFSVAVHYRLVPRRRWRGIEREFRRLSAPIRAKHGFELTRGKMALEVRPAAHWNKGDASLWIWQKFAPRAVPVFFGDDLTDQDAFRAIRDVGITVSVGRRLRGAAFYLEDVNGVWAAIRKIISWHESVF